MNRAYSTTLAVGTVLALTAVASPAAGSTPQVRPPMLPDKERAFACRQDVYPANPNVSPGPGSHVAGIEELDNGALIYTFNAPWLEGPRTQTKWGEAPVTRVYTSTLPVGKKSWTTPRRVDYDRPHQIHNAVPWNNGAGTLFKFFTVMESDWDHSGSTLEVVTSRDQGESWSNPRMMHEEHGFMFGTRAFRMSNGEVILPVYREVDPNGVGFFISDDDFQTWETYPSEEEEWPGSTVGGMQASVVELDPGHLVAYMRTSPLIWKTESHDYGRTWSKEEPTQLTNSGGRVALLKLDNGNLLLAHNPNPPAGRTPMRLALSEDGGRTWPHSVLVETDLENRFDYPYLIQSSDGFIHLGYTHNDKSNMRHVVFNEEYVRSGEDIPSNTSFRATEYRHGELREARQCHYVRTPR